MQLHEPQVAWCCSDAQSGVHGGLENGGVILNGGGCGLGRGTNAGGPKAGVKGIAHVSLGAHHVTDICIGSSTGPSGTGSVTLALHVKKKLRFKGIN